jgi:5-formyltetrahydrofolate cyclo-ligase
MDDLSQAKAALRARISEVLAGLDAGRRRQAGVALAHRLAEVPAFEGAGTVMAFLSLPTEIDTWPTIRKCWSVGKRVAVPRVDPPDDTVPLGERRMVPAVLPKAEVASLAEHADVRTGTFGIPMVPGAEPLDVSEIDLVLAPCQAVDRRGNRLGKGGGFYDRFLAQTGLRATVVAVGYDEQMVESVPAGPHDRRVDMAVTDGGAVDFRERKP